MNYTVNRGTAPNGKKAFIIITAVLCVILAVLIALTVMLPREGRFKFADESNMKSVSATENGWFGLSEENLCYYSNEENLNLKLGVEELQTESGENLIGKYRGIFVGNDYIWVTTQHNDGGYLFQFALKSETELELLNYTAISGDIYALEEDGDVVYLFRSENTNFKICRYSLSGTKNAGLNELWSTYLYTVSPLPGKVDLTKVRGNADVQSFYVDADYIYLFTKGKVFRVSKTKDALAHEHTEDGNGLHFTCDINDYDFLKDEYTLFYYTEPVFGHAIDRDTGEVYCSFGKKMLAYNTADLDEVFVAGAINEDLKLRDLKISYAKNQTPIDNAIRYNRFNKTAYVLFSNSREVKFVDLSSYKHEKTEFTISLAYDIRNITVSNDKANTYYLYEDRVNGLSGFLYLKSIDTQKHVSAKTLQIFVTLSAVLLVFAVIVEINAILCWKKDGFYIWLKGFGKDVVKQPFVYLIIICSLILLGTFCYYPAIGSITTSFFNYTADRTTRIWNNFANYKAVFTNQFAGEAFRNMFTYLFFDLLFAIVPPLIFAFFLTIMSAKKFSAVMRTLLFIPGIIPGIATTLIWKSGIYGEYGVLNTLISSVFHGEKVQFFGPNFSAVWPLIMMGFPFVGSYLIFYGAMMNIPDSYYEAGELEGITVTKRFFMIDVPMIVPQLKYVFILSFIASPQNFGRTEIVTNGVYGDMTPIFQMYSQIRAGEYGKSSAYATIIFIFLFIATFINMRIQAKDKIGD